MWGDRIRGVRMIGSELSNCWTGLFVTGDSRMLEERAPLNDDLGVGTGLVFEIQQL